MAHRPQHPLQIMETQTRFDLNAAVVSWQQELAVEPGLTFDARRELETHLRDTIRELQQRGLIVRRQFEGMPLRVEYSLTELGRGLQPVLDAIVEWGLTGVHEEILGIASSPAPVTASDSCR